MSEATEHAESSSDRASGEVGGVYSLRLGGQKETIVTSREVFEELCDEKRFCKHITGGIAGLGELLGDGLITARSHHEKWHVSHALLKPLMGPERIRDMFEDMKDICSQLCLKWARAGETTPLDVSSQFTCLALDTIGLCAFNHRFNSFYGNGGAHTIIKDIIDFLGEADIQSVLPDYINKWVRCGSVAKQKARIRRCRDLLSEVIKHRRENPSTGNDVLTSMLNARDPKTGERWSDEFILDNVVTFITAGKETTAGLLAFALGYLLENKAAMQKARDEVDRVVGQDSITLEHLRQLPFVEAVLRETLRLQPISPGMYLLGYRGDEVLAKKYLVKHGDPIFVVLHAVQRDTTVYGEDADEFRPERMGKDGFSKLPNGAWKAFGNGARACIGRAFAWQEAMLVGLAPHTPKLLYVFAYYETTRPWPRSSRALRLSKTTQTTESSTYRHSPSNRLRSAYECACAVAGVLLTLPKSCTLRASPWASRWRQIPHQVRPWNSPASNRK